MVEGDMFVRICSCGRSIFEVSSCVHRTFIAFGFVFLLRFPAGPSSHLQAQAEHEKEEPEKKEENTRPAEDLDMS